MYAVLKIRISVLAAVLLMVAGCIDPIPAEGEQSGNPSFPPPPLPVVASLLAELPIGPSQVREVHDAVSSSSANGYDEEYTMSLLFETPGAGVGDSHLPTKSGQVRSYDRPLSEMIREHVSTWFGGQTRSAGEGPGGAGADGAEAFLKGLAGSDIQIYWPFSERWDGKTLPVVTFDPEDESSANIGYRLVEHEDGSRGVEQVVVDEALSETQPVWVVNRNSDDGFLSLEIMRKLYPAWTGQGGEIIVRPAVKSVGDHGSGFLKTLILKDFTVHRNFDSWFAGASEFFVKCGAVEDFRASTEAELQLYDPAVTDFMIVVKRKDVGKVLPFNAVLVSEWTGQLDNSAFMITEDDGGMRTSWKCKALVRVESKSFGIELELPFRTRDDVVWRGMLSRRYFEKNDNVVGHFGDTDITFELLER